MHGGAVIPAAGGRQLGALLREDSDIVEALLRGEPRVARQNLRRTEVNRALKNRLGKAGRRLNGNSSQARLIDGIPVFQRRFQVAFEKINRGEKFPRVGIVRIEPQRGAQVTLRRGEILLLVVDARQLDEKSRLARSFRVPRFQRQARFAPFLPPGKRQASNKIEVRRLTGRTLRQLRRLLPLPCVKGGLRGGNAVSIGRNFLVGGGDHCREEK